MIELKLVKQFLTIGKKKKLFGVFNIDEKYQASTKNIDSVTVSPSHKNKYKNIFISQNTSE